MFFRDVKGTEKLCIYKEGRNKTESLYNIRNKIVDNQIVAIVSMSGGGKSVFTNVLANELNEDCDYTIVYVTEKRGDEFANAFCCFPPKQHYHLNLLKTQYKKKLNEGYKLEDIFRLKPIKLYHHFTFNIPYRRKMPPIRWITSSIKELNDVKLNAIIPGESQVAIEICEDIAKSLNDDDTIFDYVWQVFLATQEQIQLKEQSNIPEELYIPPEPSAGKVTLRNIKQGLKTFSKTDFYLHHNNSPYKLDYISMLNDNKHWHFHSTKWLTTKKSKLLSIIDFLIGIDTALSSGKIKHNVCLVIEELKILIGSEETTKQENILLDVLYDILSRIRTKAFVIGTMQSYFDINPRFTGLFNKVFLGRINFNDIKRLIKDHQMRKDDQDKLLELKIGEFVLWEKQEDEEDRLSSKILIDVPPFANAEEKEEFIEEYRKYYPEKMSDNRQFYNRMLKYKKRIEQLSANRLKKWYEQQKKVKAKRELKKEGKIEELKSVIKEEKFEKLEMIMKQVYDMKQNNPQMSWRKIAEKVPGIKHHRTAKKYYELMEDRLSLVSKAPKLA